MSDYWISKTKYFCKYCDIYIADDAPSRQLHENGLRHKGNVERFIRGIYKSSEKERKDLDEEKREMRRVEKAAAAAFSQDVGAGIASASVLAPSTSSATKKPPAKPSNPFANYSTAQSLGYSDPDAERIVAQMELRRSQGVAGDWQYVTTPQPPVDSTSHTALEPTPTSTTADSSDVVIKREADDFLDPEDARAFKLRKKTVNAGLGEIYDPGIIPIKVKKRENAQDVKTEEVPGPSNVLPIGTSKELPKWTSVQWNRPGDSSRPAEADQNSSSTTQEEAAGNGKGRTSSSASLQEKWARPQWSEPLPDLNPEQKKSIFGNDIKNEETSSEVPSQPTAEVKAEIDVKLEDDQAAPPSSSTNSLFKKRKVPPQSTGRVRRPI